MFVRHQQPHRHLALTHMIDVEIIGDLLEHLPHKIIQFLGGHHHGHACSPVCSLRKIGTDDGERGKMAILEMTQRGAVCHLTMNAPERLNALSDEMLAALHGTSIHWHRMPPFGSSRLPVLARRFARDMICAR